MKKIVLLLAGLSLLAPTFASAAQYQYDAAITQGSVSFSQAQFYAGETVRIYANIVNLGTSDISGGVSFFQGASALAAPSPFSLKANGANEDVWIDWTPLEGTYNIMLKIETRESDQNQSNNTHVTPMMTIAKRVPVPPPPPIPSPSSQGIAQAPAPSQGGSVGQTIPVGAVQKKNTILSSAAEIIAQKLTPKLPINPTVNRNAVAAKQSKKDVSVAASAIQAKPESKRLAVQQPTPIQAVLGESVQREPDAVVAPSIIQEKAQGFESKQATREKQTDPVRSGVALAVLFTLLFLGVGFYFLKISRE